MAGIDKMYGTTEQYDELFQWFKSHGIDVEGQFYPRDGYEEEIRLICNLKEAQDFYLMDNCNIEWVQERLKEQYNEDFIRDEMHNIEHCPFCRSDILDVVLEQSYWEGVVDAYVICGKCGAEGKHIDCEDLIVSDIKEATKLAYRLAISSWNNRSC